MGPKSQCRTHQPGENSPSQGKHSMTELIKWLCWLFSNFLLPVSLTFSPVFSVQIFSVQICTLNTKASIHFALSTFSTLPLALFNVLGSRSTGFGCRMNLSLRWQNRNTTCLLFSGTDPAHSSSLSLFNLALFMYDNYNLKSKP